ncbi:arylsulfatase [uncultured Sphingomonas sp.]|uniref:arylsulfatase n=1 Tax=uncultured Sphingomonas sp. TaxID=158754 RepID=UPI00258CDBAC|nr:arylsulfatase [uncultured Sphingomonas sp.]
MTRSMTALAVILSLAAGPAQAQASTRGEAPPFQGTIGRTLAESTEAWPAPARAPAGAPNIVWILLDDVGYGAASAFGGGISTPWLEELARQGLRYTNFHTTAICAPTRAALLTGRNSSSVHEAGFSHRFLSAGFPGWDGRLPSSAGTIAEILRDNGYNTFAVGKYGVTPDDDATDAGPFDRWPTGKGFDHFFGFLGSQTDQYKPDLVEDQAHVAPDGRHLSEQITDKAIAFIDRQQNAASGASALGSAPKAPPKPFFLYYAPGATHAPHQVPADWRDRYRGRFDAGWDVYRQQVFARQKTLGVIPANAVLPERDPAIRPWTSLSPEERKLYARFMEVYAGYLSYTDAQIGRLIDHLKQIDQFDNTLFVVVIGDNGASKEGTLNGDIDRSLTAPPLDEKANLAHNLALIDKIGTPEGIEANYPLGWAQAANTPFRCWKQDANCEGGTRNPLILSYPKGIAARGVREQYGHVIDLLPTTLELAKIAAPATIRGIAQQPIEGTSLAYSIGDATAASRHRTQYYYIFGARAIYQDGWKASLAAATSFNAPPGLKVETPKWRLFNLNEDPTERIDLAVQNPAKLAELTALFDREAQAHNLYPLITWEDVQKKVRSALQAGAVRQPEQRK